MVSSYKIFEAQNHLCISINSLPFPDISETEVINNSISRFQSSGHVCSTQKHSLGLNVLIWAPKNDFSEITIYI